MTALLQYIRELGDDIVRHTRVAKVRDNIYLEGCDKREVETLLLLLFLERKILRRRARDRNAS